MYLLGVEKVQISPLKGTARATSCCIPKCTILNPLFPVCMCPLEACVLHVNVALLFHPTETQNHFHRLLNEMFAPGGMTCPTQSEQLSPYPSSRNGYKHISSIFNWPSNSSTLYYNSILKKNTNPIDFLIFLYLYYFCICFLFHLLYN